jgi:hypothetical protein
MLNSLLSLPAVVGECFRSLDLALGSPGFFFAMNNFFFT